MRKKIMSYLLCITLLITAFPFIPSSRAYAASVHYEDYNGVYKLYNKNDEANKAIFDKLLADSELPPNTQPMSKNPKTGEYDNFPFNYRLWFLKHVVVYGDYYNITNNDFDEVDDGFYYQDVKNPVTGNTTRIRGEYRYRGFTVEGSPYANSDRFYDSFLGGTPATRNWVYRPWANSFIKDKFTGDKTVYISPYNDDAIKGNTIISKWINDSLTTWKIDPNHIFTNGTVIPKGKVPSTNFVDYMNVQTCPTLNYPGDMRGFHYEYSTNKIWYWDFSMKPIGEKAPTDTETTLTAKVIGDSTVDFHDEVMNELHKNDLLTVKATVTGIIHDENYKINTIDYVTHYNRGDIKQDASNGWIMNVTNNFVENITPDGKPVVDKNTATQTFTLKFKRGVLKTLYNPTTKHYEVTLFSKSKAIYKNGKDSGFIDSKPCPIIFDDKIQPKDPEPEKVFVEIHNNIPEIAFDIVPFVATDTTDMSKVKSRTVSINGIPVDAAKFFSGNYVFGIGNTGWQMVNVTYISTTGEVASSLDWIYVYDTKPYACFALDGSFKQNRRMTVTDTSDASNIALVVAKYPIVSYNWTFTSNTGDITSLKTRTATETSKFKEFIYKTPGSYKIQLTVTNSLGRTSDPYNVDFEIFDDIAPAIELNIWNASLPRGESLDITEGVSSTDGDSIVDSTIDIYQDKDNDGEAESLILSKKESDYTPYKPTALGMYKMVITAKEDFGEQTLSEFVMAADKKSKTLERSFMVDNFIPMTDLYVDIPLVRTQVDAFIMLDKDLDSTKCEYVKSNRMNIDNSLRLKNLLPQVNTWDMHTYVYDQPASTSVNTGTTYPAATTTYTSNGYSGTLSRTSVSDNGGNHDFGSYQTKTESKTATGSGSGYSYNYYTYNGSSWVGTGSEGSDTPSISYSDAEGYSGTLYKNGFVCVSDNGTPSGTAAKGATYTRVRIYSATYSGTVSRQVKYWVPDIRWVSNYTGFYSGTIYKNVRQPYTDPFRATSYKYVIYVSDGNISELNDLKSVMSKTDAKLILIGQDSIKSQITYDKFFLNNKPIADLIKDVVDYIGGQYAYTAQYTVVAGADTFNFSTADFDTEGDNIIESTYQYVHDPNYFDNSQGQETGTVLSYSDDAANWTTTVKNKFNKVGKYTIYHRTKDKPSNDPNFANYSYYSNVSALEIIAHRIPIALATLDWNYDTTKNVYKTNWVDKSYDLDHQFSRADKGIVERKIMFRQIGGDWSYTIPSELSAGTYELQYYVKDIEGAWSLPYSMNFTLNDVPPMQMNASARPLDSKFSMSSIPASEYLEVYNLKTRYPYLVNMDIALYNSAGITKVSTSKPVSYSAATGTKTGNDIAWNNISYQIPATLADGNYILRVTAVGTSGQNKYIDFPVTVNTPINLVGYINGTTDNATIATGDTSKFTCTTSKYVTSVEMTFNGKTYTSAAGQIKKLSSTGDIPTWEMSLDIPAGALAEGATGKAIFKALLPTNVFQMVTVNYKVESVALQNLRITKITDYDWQSIFEKPDGNPTQLQKDGIGTAQMPVYRNKNNAYISLGFKVNFKIDSRGLYESGDNIGITASFYALDDKNLLYPVDIYVQNPYGEYILLGDSSYQSKCGSITLINSSEEVYKQDATKPTCGIWSFDYYIPYSAKVVKKGEKLDLYKDNTFKNKLLVTFDITGVKKKSGNTYDYTSKETAWGSVKSASYGFSQPTGLNLLGKGKNHGEVFWYNLGKTAADFIDMDRTW